MLRGTTLVGHEFLFGAAKQRGLTQALALTRDSNLMGKWNKVMIAVMALLSGIHLFDFYKSHEIFHIVAAVGFALMAYAAFKNPNGYKDASGQLVVKDKLAWNLGITGAVLVVVYFALRFIGPMS